MQAVLLNAVTATTTGAAVGVADVQRLTFQFLAANISSGNGVFKIQGSVDGSNYVDLAFIDNLANTNAQTLTRVASKTLSSNGSAIAYLDDFAGFRFIRAVVTKTTDGTYSCFMTGNNR